MKISTRALTLPVSSIRILMPYALEAGKKGRTIYRLNIGEPDLSPPQEVIDALHNLNVTNVPYADSQGDPEFISALVEYYKKIGFGMVKTENILITQGSSEGLTYCMWAVANPGDEIIVFEPYFVNYSLYSHIGGVKIKAVSTEINNDFHLPNKAEIIKAITPKTRAILYTNPNNPTGTVYTKQEVEMLIEIAEEYNLYLIADEVYRELNFTDRKHVSILDYFERIKDRLILSDSLSKRYCLCGARLGCLVVFNPELFQSLYKLTTSRLSAGFIEQKICSVLGKISPKYSVKLTKEFKKRRDICEQILGKMYGVTIASPEGAFYIMAKLPIKNAMDFATWLLTDFSDKNETVLITPASGFYLTKGRGEDEIRIAYVLEEKKLRRALELIQTGLEQYKKTRSPI